MTFHDFMRTVGVPSQMSIKCVWMWVGRTKKSSQFVKAPWCRVDCRGSLGTHPLFSCRRTMVRWGRDLRVGSNNPTVVNRIACMCWESPRKTGGVISSWEIHYLPLVIYTSSQGIKWYLINVYFACEEHEQQTPETWIPLPDISQRNSHCNMHGSWCVMQHGPPLDLQQTSPMVDSTQRDLSSSDFMPLSPWGGNLSLMLIWNIESKTP